MVGTKISGILMVIAFFPASCSTARPATVECPERVVITNDYAAACRSANSEGKKLLVSLLSEVCALCATLEFKEFKNPAIEPLLHDHFIEARFYEDAPGEAIDPAASKLRKRYVGHRAAPVLLIIDPATGNLVNKLEGLHSTEKLAAFLEGKGR